MMSQFLLLDNILFELQNYNNEFLLLKTEAPKKTHHIGKTILDQQFDFIEEVIATEVEICLKLTDKFTAPRLSELSALNFEKKAASKILSLPIWFDGDHDIQNIVEQSGKSKSEIIASIEASEFSVAMFGFLPGFVYMNGLDKSLHTPRKTTPSVRIPANSLAIGSSYLGIYSLPSPGGWHVIGKLACPIINLPNVPPILIDDSHTLKIKSIDAKSYQALQNDKIDVLTYNR